MGKQMPIYHCSCGTNILVVPDVSKMVVAIRAHLIEHRIITGKKLSEKSLTEEILACLSDEQVDDCIDGWLRIVEQEQQ